MLSNGIQNKLLNIGSEGCYFLSILYCCGCNDEDVFKIYTKAVNMNIILEDCFVNDAVALFNLCGTPIKFCEKTIYDRGINYSNYAIARYVNGRNNHFVVLDKYKNVIFDPLGESNTVKNGYIKDYRFFYI